MPERNPTVRPTIIAGTNLESGTPNTGQVQYTLGGSRMYHEKSGVVGPDVSIRVGGGRLDAVILYPPATAAAGPAASGLPLVFYDSAVVVSGGPLATSGHNVIASIHPNDPAIVASPIYNSGLGILGRVVFLGVPYTSGLVHTTLSGRVGFTAIYTPVISG